MPFSRTFQAWKSHTLISELSRVCTNPDKSRGGFDPCGCPCKIWTAWSFSSCEFEAFLCSRLHMIAHQRLKPLAAAQDPTGEFRCSSDALVSWKGRSQDLTLQRRPTSPQPPTFGAHKRRPPLLAIDLSLYPVSHKNIPTTFYVIIFLSQHENNVGIIIGFISSIRYSSTSRMWHEMVWQNHQWDNKAAWSTFAHRRLAPFILWSYLPIT